MFGGHRRASIVDTPLEISWPSHTQKRSQPKTDFDKSKHTADPLERTTVEYQNSEICKINLSSMAIVGRKGLLTLMNALPALVIILHDSTRHMLVFKQAREPRRNVVGEEDVL